MTIFFFFTFLLIPLIRSGCSFFTSIVIQLWIIEKDKTIGPLKKHSRWSCKSGSTEWILKASCGSSSWLCDHFSLDQSWSRCVHVCLMLTNISRWREFSVFHKSYEKKKRWAEKRRGEGRNTYSNQRTRAIITNEKFSVIVSRERPMTLNCS